MFSPGMPLYLSLPSESTHRVLHPGRVSDLIPDGLTFLADEPDLTGPAGQPATVYFEHNQKFMQHAGQLEAVLESAPLPLLAVRLIGKPASAEGRECYRVSTLTADLRADLAGEAGCRLTDVSATGFSLIARGDYSMGSVLPVALHHEDGASTGSACVQSVKPLGRGFTRYGFLAVNEGRGGSPLVNALSRISIMVQRMQLQRRQGAA